MASHKWINENDGMKPKSRRNEKCKKCQGKKERHSRHVSPAYSPVPERAWTWMSAWNITQGTNNYSQHTLAHTRTHSLTHRAQVSSYIQPGLFYPPSPSRSRVQRRKGPFFFLLLLSFSFRSWVVRSWAKFWRRLSFFVLHSCLTCLLACLLASSVAYSSPFETLLWYKYKIWSSALPQWSIHGHFGKTTIYLGSHQRMVDCFGKVEETCDWKRVPESRDV